MRRLPYPGASRRVRRQARSGIEPSRAWQAGRGNSLARVHITGRYAARPQSLRCASLGGSAPRNTRYVPRAPGPALRPAAGPPQPKTGGCCGRGCAPPPKHHWPRASRSMVKAPRPAPAVCCARASALRALRPGLAAVLPSAPAGRGLPNTNTNSRTRTAKQPVQRSEGRTATTERASRHWPPRLAPCSPRQGQALTGARAARP